METRLASVDDAPALAALHGESFGAARWNLVQISDSLNLPTTQGWVVVDNAVPQGFILCQIVGDEAEILTFCVSPAARRKGAGRKLLAVALDGAKRKNAARIFLEVAADNNTALGLYEKSGFRIIGKRAGYYQRGGQSVDAVMLGLDF